MRCEFRNWNGGELAVWTTGQSPGSKSMGTPCSVTTSPLVGCGVPGSTTSRNRPGARYSSQTAAADRETPSPNFGTMSEPLEGATTGADVTAQRRELVASVTALAESHPEVRNCHEVVVTDTDEGLSVVMHCEASPGLSVAQVHNASTRIEDEVHRRWPEVARVTVSGTAPSLVPGFTLGISEHSEGPVEKFRAENAP